MVEFLAVKRMNGDLHPTNEQGEAYLRGIKQGDIVTINVKRPRNPYFHAKYFALLNLVLKNQEHYKSVEELLVVAKIATGHVDAIQTKRWGTVYLPKSISFAAMDESEFQEMYDRTMMWVFTDVIPGLSITGMDAEVEAELLAFGAPEG